MELLADRNADIIVYKIVGRVFFSTIFSFYTDKKHEQNEQNKQKKIIEINFENVYICDLNPL